MGFKIPKLYLSFFLIPNLQKSPSDFPAFPTQHTFEHPTKAQDDIVAPLIDREKRKRKLLAVIIVSILIVYFVLIVGVPAYDSYEYSKHPIIITLNQTTTWWSESYWSVYVSQMQYYTFQESVMTTTQTYIEVKKVDGTIGLSSRAIFSIEGMNKTPRLWFNNVSIDTTVIEDLNAKGSLSELMGQYSLNFILEKKVYSIGSVIKLTDPSGARIYCEYTIV